MAWLGLRQWQGDGKESSARVSQLVAFVESCIPGVRSGSIGPHMGQTELERLENQDGGKFNRGN